MHDVEGHDVHEEPEPEALEDPEAQRCPRFGQDPELAAPADPEPEAPEDDYLKGARGFGGALWLQVSKLRKAPRLSTQPLWSHFEGPVLH